MGSLKFTALAASAALLAGVGAAVAADMPVPPVIEAPEVAPPVEVGAGWYLRGDVGVSVFKEAECAQADLKDAGGRYLDCNMDKAAFVDVGVGYKFNEWIRADVLVDLRGTEQFRGIDQYPFTCTFAFGSCQEEGQVIDRNNIQTGSINTKVVLANVYFDLGKFHGLTPFVGAGVGGAYHRVHGVTDIDPSEFGGGGFAPEATDWSFAWALHAGLAYEVAPNLSLEIAYRYLNMGDAISGKLHGLPTGHQVLEPIEIKDIESHDVKIGMRWQFSSGKCCY